jgi:hypothetical protein
MPATQNTYEPPFVFRPQIRRPHILLMSLVALFHVALAYRAEAATIIWNGPTGADTNWSTGSNWTNATAGTSGTAPASGDDVKFFDTGSLGSASNINNTVDAAVRFRICKLQDHRRSARCESLSRPSLAQ